MNTCTIEGCTKAHRAKGLCSTHYNQTHVASRHQKVEERCDYCGDTTLKAPNQRARWGHVYCSLMCRDLAKIVPQSMGGTHEPTNLATAHMSCNSRRGASLTW